MSGAGKRGVLYRRLFISVNHEPCKPENTTNDNELTGIRQKTKGKRQKGKDNKLKSNFLTNKTEVIPLLTYHQV